MALFHDRGLDETIEALWGMGIGSFRTLVVVVSVCTGRLGSYPLSLGMFSVFRTVDSFDLFVSASNLSFFDFSGNSLRNLVIANKTTTQPTQLEEIY